MHLTGLDIDECLDTIEKYEALNLVQRLYIT